MSIKIGDKFWCNKLLVEDALDTIFTIGDIYNYCDEYNFSYKQKIRIVWNDNKSSATYDYDVVEKYLANGTWLDIKSERREKLKKLNLL